MSSVQRTANIVRTNARRGDFGSKLAPETFGASFVEQSVRVGARAVRGTRFKRLHAACVLWGRLVARRLRRDALLRSSDRRAPVHECGAHNGVGCVIL